MDPQADHDNVLQRKQKLTNVVIGFIFLLSGIEYAVILPTVWMYLQTLDAQPFFLGLVLSAFSLTELLSGPVFGHWSDRTGKTKHVILLSNCFEIAGNFMYFVGLSKWFLLASRLVAGIGAGAGASIFGYLTQHSSSKERVPVFAMAMACRQAGLLIGPAFNIFLRYCTFQLGPFHVDKFSAPGIFMCVLWTLLQFMVIFMFYDVSLNATQSSNQEHEPLLKERDTPSQFYGTIISGEPSSNQEDIATIESASINASCPTENDHLHPTNNEDNKNFNNVKPVIGLLREEIVVLLTAQFVTFFNQTALETLVTPLAQTYLDFEDLQNSLLYFLCGIEIRIRIRVSESKPPSPPSTTDLLPDLLPASSRSRDACRPQGSSRPRVQKPSVGISQRPRRRRLRLRLQPRPPDDPGEHQRIHSPPHRTPDTAGSYGFLLTEFIIGVFLQVLGLPFVSVSQVSLFSKMTAEKTQGFNHGIRRSIGGIATILGPLWAAGLTQNLYIMLGVMMGLLLLITIMFSLSYKYLVEPSPSETDSS